MTNKSLSPAAQAVLDTALDAEFCIEFSDLEATMKASVQRVVAAALRAAAEQVVPIEYETILGCWYEKKNNVREQLLTIATELEGADG